MKKNKDKTKLIKKLKNKHRLVIMNDITFEEKFSFLLSPLNVFTAFGIIIIFVMVITYALITYTGLKQIIPGYPDEDIRAQTYNNATLLEQQQTILSKNEAYINNLQSILRGEIPSDSVTKMPEKEDIVVGNFHNSPQDSAFRTQIEAEDRYNVIVDRNNKNAMKGLFLYTPVRGEITGSFNMEKGHFGVDIVSANPNESIMAILEGTVVLASWTADGGHVIGIQHENDLISIYKHNSVLLKKVGDVVKAGEPIAIIGNSGAETDGPHLHLELWLNGRPIDPQNFLIF